MFDRFLTSQLIGAKDELRYGIVRYAGNEPICEAFNAALERIEDELDHRYAMEEIAQLEAQECDREFDIMDELVWGDDQYEWVIERRYEEARAREARL